MLPSYVHARCTYTFTPTKDMFTKSKETLANTKTSTWGHSGRAGVSLDKTTKPPQLFGMVEVPIERWLWVRVSGEDGTCEGCALDSANGIRVEIDFKNEADCDVDTDVGVGMEIAILVKWRRP